ncbi:hypothetical protein MHYP_G00006250 [Metynnis hypsauchen]
MQSLHLSCSFQCRVKDSSPAPEDAWCSGQCPGVHTALMTNNVSSCSYLNGRSDLAELGESVLALLDCGIKHMHNAKRTCSSALIHLKPCILTFPSHCGQNSSVVDLHMLTSTALLNRQPGKWRRRAALHNEPLSCVCVYLRSLSDKFTRLFEGL